MADNLIQRDQIKDAHEYPETIVQFGEGNFIRAFADWMVEQMNQKADFKSQIVVIQPVPEGKVDILNQQEGLFTICLSGVKGKKVVSESSLVQCVNRGINPYRDYEAFVESAKNPQMRFIISNTTEAGIAYDEKDQLSDQPPNSFPAKLTVWLYERFKSVKGNKKKGMIVIPCEVIDRNGDRLKKIVQTYIHNWHLGQDFLTWIEQANVFCNTLVDRFAPGFPQERASMLWKELGYRDNLMVEAEHFHLWVIEAPKGVKKEFPAEKAGLNVLFTDDLAPYYQRKMRLLMGTRTAVAPIAYLYGMNQIHEAVEHEALHAFIERMVHQEIIPSLDGDAKELANFGNEVIERLNNPSLRHNLIDMTCNAMQKFDERIKPSIVEYQQKKQAVPQCLAFSLATYIKFYQGERSGEVICLDDEDHILELFKEVWYDYDGTPPSLRRLVEKVLVYRRRWEINMNNIPDLTESVYRHLLEIEQKGLRKALQALLDS